MAKRSRGVKKSGARTALFTVAAILLVIVIAVAAILYFVKPDLYHKFLGVGDHKWGEWEQISPADCGNNGKQKRVCTVCGEEENEVIPATGNHSWGGWEQISPADCGNNGEQKRVCTVCGEEDNEVIPATGNHSWSDDGVCTVCGQTELIGSLAEANESLFSVHFIDLGKYAGDSVYIKAGENDILIDAGARAANAPQICEYLSDYVEDGKLEYVIATHADQDHIEAFAGNASGSTRTGVLYNFQVGTFIMFDNVKPDKEQNKNKPTTTYGKFNQAVEYIKGQGAAVYTASQCYDLKDGAQRQYWLNDEHTLSMNILYNYYYYHTSNDENNHSVVTLFTYDTAGGRRNYLFTGDLEEDGESKMVDYYAAVPAEYATEYNVLPEVELYKAGHHGSKTSSTLKLLNVIKPKLVAVSCCAGSNEYSSNPANVFPTQTAVDNILMYTDKIFVTGQAINMPAVGADGNFENGGYDYTPCNGNIVVYFKETGKEQGKVKGRERVICSNSNVTLPQTEWFRQFRAHN